MQDKVSKAETAHQSLRTLCGGLTTSPAFVWGIYTDAVKCHERSSDHECIHEDQLIIRAEGRPVYSELADKYAEIAKNAAIIASFYTNAARECDG